MTAGKNRLIVADLFLLSGYASCIYWLSDQPQLYAPMWFAHQDKIYHAGAYFVLALLAWRSFRHFATKPFALMLSTLVFCSLYGVSDEWHQSFVAGRSADFTDWLADTAGAALAVAILFRKTNYDS